MAESQPHLVWSALGVNHLSRRWVINVCYKFFTDVWINFWDILLKIWSHTDVYRLHTHTEWCDRLCVCVCVCVCVCESVPMWTQYFIKLRGKISQNLQLQQCLVTKMNWLDFNKSKFQRHDPAKFRKIYFCAHFLIVEHYAVGYSRRLTAYCRWRNRL